jgi:hypothetical protein
MTLTNLVITCIAIGSISRMIMRDDGPLDIIKRFRIFIGLKDGDIDKGTGGYWASLVSCINCTSLQLSIVFLAMMALAPTVSYWFAMVFVVRYGATLVFYTYYPMEALCEISKQRIKCYKGEGCKVGAGEEPEGPVSSYSDIFDGQRQ